MKLTHIIEKTLKKGFKRHIFEIDNSINNSPISGYMSLELYNMLGVVFTVTDVHFFVYSKSVKRFSIDLSDVDSERFSKYRCIYSVAGGYSQLEKVKGKRSRNKENLQAIVKERNLDVEENLNAIRWY